MINEPGLAVHDLSTFAEVLRCLKALRNECSGSPRPAAMVSFLFQADQAIARAEADEPAAFLVEWKQEGETWVDAHACEVRAVDQARAKGGVCTPLFRGEVA